MEMFQPNLMEGQIHQLEMAHSTSDGDNIIRMREFEDFESRSGSENQEAASGEDQQNNKRGKRKRYHRHTQHQIQEMEA